MPYYWDKTLGTEDSVNNKWDFNRWEPDLLVIHLGSNDYTLNMSSLFPHDDVFLTAYWDFMRTVTQSYSKPPTIISVCGGRDFFMTPCPKVKKAAEEAKDHIPLVESHYIEIPSELIGDNDWGCWGHRNRQG